MADDRDRTFYSSKSDVAYAELRGRILSGELAAGLDAGSVRARRRRSASASPRCARPSAGSAARASIVLDTHRNARRGPHRTPPRPGSSSRPAVPSTPPPSRWRLRTPHRRRHRPHASSRCSDCSRHPEVGRGRPSSPTARCTRPSIVASHNDVLIRLLDDLWDKSDRYRRVGSSCRPAASPAPATSRSTGDGRARRRRRTRGSFDLMRTHIDNSLTATVLATEAGTAALVS